MATPVQIVQYSFEPERQMVKKGMTRSKKRFIINIVI
jgi:hypothetical protein